MKLSIPSLALLSTASAFSISPAFLPTTSTFSSSTSLFASKNKSKIASRSKWAESRGIAASVVEESAASSGLMTNDGGLEYVKLVKGDSSADIYLYGGVVTSYIKEGIEYIAVRPDAKMDGSKPISGGLSHCWPQVS